MEPIVRFCKSADGTRIAYAKIGKGPPLFFANTWVMSMDAQFTWPDARAFFDAIAEHATLLIFDRRGTGASERDVSDLSPQVEAEDIAAVVEATGIGEFPLFADATAGAACACYAAAEPERVRRLIIWAPHTSTTYPHALQTAQQVLNDWSYFRRVWAGQVFPNGPIHLQRAASKAFKESVSPMMAARRFEAQVDLDLLALLRAVAQPTLVLQRDSPVARGWETPIRQLGMKAAAAAPDGQMQSVPGVTPTAYPEHERLLEVALEFAGIPSPDRTPSEKELPSGTAIILFADIVDSTALTERLGDAAFRDKARDLDTALRAIIRQHSGTAIEGKLLGDGVLGVFTSARQAIEAALACGRAGAGGGLPLHLGIHAGDVIREDNNVYGGAVNIAARISALSSPGEVLVSDTVRSLARTSAGVTFADHGEHSLKGIEEPVHVYEVRLG